MIDSSEIWINGIIKTEETKVFDWY